MPVICSSTSNELRQEVLVPSKRSSPTTNPAAHAFEQESHPQAASQGQTKIAFVPEGYFKDCITSHGFSPDAFVQMAFQAAYFGLYGAYGILRILL
jgi:hypothetical protein